MVRNSSPATTSNPGKAGKAAASADDVHEAALALPHVTVESAKANPVYQVGVKSFVFFRNPRKDAFDPRTGERYDDVIVIWVGGESDKQALVQAPDLPFFTTPHFNGHPSVLVRASRLHEVTRDEIIELVEEAWLAQASRRRADAWLAERGLTTD
ncbi:MmcQ/YjbR family DNA-binding protein [Knoellia sp. CPCC 206453]|uniref:MmcQ/YjbR family DNA-binding protein n=1 Tax=Knoellia pratensis TaxID=3404796 RepID=UPI0036115BC8